MKYVTIAELNQTIRTNFYRIPHNIDFVIGVPRSGMLPATIIAEYLNVPLTDLNSFVNGQRPSGGMRLGFKRPGNLTQQKVLVVDDTTFNGTSIRTAKSLLKGLSKIYDITYMVVYKEGRSTEPDIWLEDISQYADPIVLYEWNIFHHYPNILKSCMYDIDGVLLPNPPDEMNEQQYLDFIKKAPPLFTTSSPIGALVSYRLESRREITEAWLKENKIEYNELLLFPSSSYDERAKTAYPSEFKAKHYRRSTWAKLFVESDDLQAREIARLSGKPVYCVESNRLY